MVFAATGSASFDFYGANRARRQPVRRLRARARRAHRQAHLALPGHEARRLGLGLPGARRARHGAARRPQRRRRRADHEDGVRVRARSPHGRSRSFRSRYARCRRRAIDGEQLAEAQPFPTEPPPFARQGLTEAMLTTRTPEAHAAVLERFQQARSPAFLHAAVPRRHDRLSRLRRRRGMGRRGVRSGDRAALRQLERDAVDRQADPEQRHVALQRELRDLPRDDRTGTPAAPSLVDIGERHDARRDRRRHPPGHRPHARRSRTWARATSTTSWSS